MSAFITNYELILTKRCKKITEIKFPSLQNELLNEFKKILIKKDVEA